jgi:selenocysteine-specific elongation factor
VQGADRAVIIGTAGHVDHGKSALVRALTGIDPDRLAEEKARGLTIDLGFAWLPLPSGVTASFVDVPGHEDFIRNMLAGAGAVDAVLFVVAADEGPMPQTLEHLAIIDQLGVSHGVVALTKADLVEDDWLDLVREEVSDLIAGTALDGAPIVPVSAVTGLGIEELRSEIDAALTRVPEALDLGRPRLSVDRAFTLPGFGTVVTGTLRDGTLSTGAAVELLPSGAASRVRGLQSLGESVETARPGTRTAINLVGIGTDDIARGDVVAPPGLFAPTSIMDVEISLLPSAPAPLSHDDPVHVFHGAAEVAGHVRVIGGSEIAPGNAGPVQIRLDRPIVVVARDRLIIRQPSPAQTIGGGVVLDPHPPGRRKRLWTETVQRFEALTSASPEEIAYHMLLEREPCAPGDLLPQDSGLEAREMESALTALLDASRIRPLGQLLITDAGWRRLRQAAESLLNEYHATHPLRPGMPSEQLRERLRLEPDVYVAFVDSAVAEAWLTRNGGVMALAVHSVAFDDEQQRAIAELLERFGRSPFSPPSAREAEEAVGAEVVAALVDQGDLVSTGGDVLFGADAFEQLKAGVLEHLDEHGKVTVADVRDRFSTSRKYALALLEYLDRQRVTRRIGDERVRGPGAGKEGGN